MIPDFLNLVRSFNWIDYISLAVVAYFILDGWHSGFLQMISSFIALISSIYVAVKYNSLIGAFINSKIGISILWANIFGYIFLILICHLIVSFIIVNLVNRIAKYFVRSTANHILGIFLGAVNALVIMAFGFLVLLALPLQGSIQKDIQSAVIAPNLVRIIEKYGGSVKSLVDTVAKQAIEFVTIRPDSDQVIKLDVKPSESDLSIDENSERIMRELINDERIKVGTVPLSQDPNLTQIARNYSRQIFIDSHFSHTDINGKDVSDRVSKSGIDYMTLGENLAYASSVNIAHSGLMESPSHKKNILDPSYTHVGVGVIDAKIYGKIFTQIFMEKPFVVRGQ